MLRPDEIIIVAGDDWSSIFPYFTERRALMIRNGKQNEPGYLRTAFADLKGEDVGALVLFEDQENNTALIELARQTFDLGPQPLLRWRHGGRRAVAYLSRRIQPDAIVELGRTNGFANLTVNPAALPVENLLAGRITEYTTLLKRHQRYFTSMHPRPCGFIPPSALTSGMPARRAASVSPQVPTFSCGSRFRPAATVCTPMSISCRARGRT